MSKLKAFQHGPITLALPVGWQDASTLTFAGRPFEGFRPNVVLTTRALGKQQDIREWAEKDKERLEENNNNAANDDVELF